MIAKVKMSNSPGKLINYILTDKQGADKMKERVVILDTNYCHGDSVAEVKAQFEMMLSNCRLKSPAMHIMISLASGEQLTELQKFDLTYAVREKMGMADFPYVAVEHLDTANHSHFHIAVARKSPVTGKTLSDSNSYQKLMAVCRQAEKDFGLQVVANPRDRKAQRSDSRKIKMRNDIVATIKQSTSLDGFIKQIEGAGYKVEKQRGIAFIDEKGMRAKGSDPQIGFPLGKLNYIFKQKERGESLKIDVDYKAIKADLVSEPESKPKEMNEASFSFLNSAIPDAAPLSFPGAKVPIDDEDEWKSKKRRKKGFKR